MRPPAARVGKWLWLFYPQTIFLPIRKIPSRATLSLRRAGARAVHARASRQRSHDAGSGGSARCTLSRRDTVSRCRCRCWCLRGEGGGRRSAAGAGQDRGTGRRRHWLTPPAPAATHWSSRCTIVASRARGRDSQRDPRKTSEKLEGPGVAGWGGVVRDAGHRAELGGRDVMEAGRVPAGSWSWICAVLGLHTRIGSLACGCCKSPALGFPCSDPH